MLLQVSGFRGSQTSKFRKSLVPLAVRAAVVVHARLRQHAFGFGVALEASHGTFMPLNVHCPELREAVERSIGQVVVYPFSVSSSANRSVWLGRPRERSLVSLSKNASTIVASLYSGA